MDFERHTCVRRRHHHHHQREAFNRRPDGYRGKEPLAWSMIAFIYNHCQCRSLRPGPNIRQRSVWLSHLYFSRRLLTFARAQWEHRCVLCSYIHSVCIDFYRRGILYCIHQFHICILLIKVSNGECWSLADEALKVQSSRGLPS